MEQKLKVRLCLLAYGLGKIETHIWSLHMRVVGVEKYYFQALFIL